MTANEPQGRPQDAASNRAPTASVPIDNAEAITSETDEASPLAAIFALRDELRATVNSEITLARTVAKTIVTATQRITMWGMIALLFAFVGLLALAVGLVIALAEYTGALAAALLVAGLWMAIGGFAAWRAFRAAKALKRATDLVLT
jgi:hypothetical protein